MGWEGPALPGRREGAPHPHPSASRGLTRSRPAQRCQLAVGAQVERGLCLQRPEGNSGSRSGRSWRRARFTSATLGIQDTLCSPGAKSPLPVRARILLRPQTLPLAVNLSSSPVLPLIPDPFLGFQDPFPPISASSSDPRFLFRPYPLPLPPSSTCFILRLRPSFGRPFSDVGSLTGPPTRRRLLFQAQPLLVPLT